MNQDLENTNKKEEKSSTLVDFNYDKYAEVERKATHTDAAAALAAGIGSILCTGIFAVGGIILGILGVVFGIRGRRYQEKKGMATAGIVCAVIGMVLSGIVIILSILFIGAAFTTDIFLDF